MCWFVSGTGIDVVDMHGIHCPVLHATKDQTIRSDWDLYMCLTEQESVCGNTCINRDANSITFLKNCLPSRNTMNDWHVHCSVEIVYQANMQRAHASASHAPPAPSPTPPAQPPAKHAQHPSTPYLDPPLVIHVQHGRSSSTSSLRGPAGMQPTGRQMSKS